MSIYTLFNVKNLYKNLFCSTKFMSTQIRILLTILILLDIIFDSHKIKKMMLIFYIPSIMALFVTASGILAFILQKKFGLFKNKVKLLEDDEDNINYYIIGLVYKIIILNYLLKNNKEKLTNDIIFETVIYMASYYYLFNVRKTYKTRLYQDIFVIIVTLRLLPYCEKLRFEKLI
jgi:hypothetical protein